MPLYTFLQNLLNVPVQSANRMGLQKKMAYGKQWLMAAVTAILDKSELSNIKDSRKRMRVTTIGAFDESHELQPGESALRFR
jgi:hypothetical protein